LVFLSVKLAIFSQYGTLFGRLYQRAIKRAMSGQSEEQSVGNRQARIKNGTADAERTDSSSLN
jgi:hypothetical protein